MQQQLKDGRVLRYVLTEETYERSSVRVQRAEHGEVDGEPVSNEKLRQLRIHG